MPNFQFSILQFFNQDPMANEQLSNKYDLEERTALFGEEIIKLCRTTKNDSLSSPILNQLIRAGTSVGANYMEANGASSRKDFRNKIFICKKEAQELTLIFQKIGSTLKISD